MAFCVSGLLLLLLACLLQCALCWPRAINSRDVCDTMHISCSINWRNLGSDGVHVSLMRAGQTVDCMKPKTVYNLVFNVLEEGDQMKGILMKPGEGFYNNSGVLASGLPSHTVAGVCGRGSVSHTCKNDNGCLLGNNGTSLSIPFRYLRNNILALKFFYTIVLRNSDAVRKYVENQSVTFPVCAPSPAVNTTITTTASPRGNETTTTATEEPVTAMPKPCTPPVLLQSHDTNLAGEPIKFCPNFDLEPKAVERPKTCGKIATYSSNETHLYQENNVTYTCNTDKRVRKTECVPYCAGDDGQRWCCKNKIHVMRKRNFTCSAVPELNSGEVPEDKMTTFVTKDVLQTKLCICYLCSDIVCPDCDKKDL